MTENIKEKLRIGIDIDECIVNYAKHFLEFYNKEHYTNFSVEDFLSFDMEKSLGISRDYLKFIAKKYQSMGIVECLSFIDGSKNSIKNLSDDFEIFLITSRPAEIRERTIAFFARNFEEPVFRIVFSNDFDGERKKKSEICTELNVPILIEDRRKYALDCAENGIKVLLMDKPWNRENCEHENIIRVRNWEEALKEVEKFKGGLFKANIIKEIKKSVEEECENHLLGNEILVNHIIPVVDYAKKLAKEKNADAEIVEIAAWLHDIGSIIHERKNHHLTGAEIAEKKLRELNYPEDKIKKVKQCILNHRGSVGAESKSIEEEILVEADCLLCFDHLEGQFLWVIERDGVKNQYEIKQIVKQKYINKFNQLSERGKGLVKNKFDAIMLLLG